MSPSAQRWHLVSSRGSAFTSLFRAGVTERCWPRRSVRSVARTGVTRRDRAAPVGDMGTSRRSGSLQGFCSGPGGDPDACTSRPLPEQSCAVSAEGFSSLLALRRPWSSRPSQRDLPMDVPGAQRGADLCSPVSATLRGRVWDEAQACPLGVCGFVVPVLYGSSAPSRRSFGFPGGRWRGVATRVAHLRGLSSSLRCIWLRFGLLKSNLLFPRRMRLTGRTWGPSCSTGDGHLSTGLFPPRVRSRGGAVTGGGPGAPLHRSPAGPRPVSRRRGRPALQPRACVSR